MAWQNYGHTIREALRDGLPSNLSKHVPMRCSTIRHKLYAIIFASLCGSILIISLRGFSTPTATWETINTIKTEYPATPKCEAFAGWRNHIPSSVHADDNALPSARLGTGEVMAMHDAQGCVPAKRRLGPFGHSASEEDQHNLLTWDTIQWGSMQSECAVKHQIPSAAGVAMSQRKLNHASSDWSEDSMPKTDSMGSTGRIAAVLRTWDDYDYYNNQRAWLRAMITELSLDTGGQYQVFLLVNVKDKTLDLWNDKTYNQTMQSSVPYEFQDMALLYNEPMLEEWYPKVSEHGAQDQMYQALQIFSHTFPEFDYVWQLEMDVRFTGNVANMLNSAAAWAKQQTRRNLWERNARWYIPSRWPDYASFSAQVDREFADGSGVWGPHPYAKFFVDPQGPEPPARSDLRWGVGEEAELINLAPLIDPVITKWTYEQAVHNFTSPALSLPRRMAIVSMTRTSRRLLHLISAEQRAKGSWIVSEATPETWSLLHGLKAVYVPHLVAFSSQSLQGPPEAVAPKLEGMLHKGPPWSLAGGEHASILWCDDVGLPEPRWLDATYFYWAGQAAETWWQYANGTCTYSLVLHPVKND